LEIVNFFRFPKRKDKKAGFTICYPIPIFQRFNRPSIGKVPTPTFFQSTFIGQSEREAFQGLVFLLEDFMPTVESDRALALINLKADGEAITRRWQHTYRRGVSFISDMRMFAQALFDLFDSILHVLERESHKRELQLRCAIRPC